MRGGRWLTTQENGFALMALGKYVRHVGTRETDYRAWVTVGGKVRAEFTHEDGARLREGLGGREIEAAVSGKGSLYYYWSAEGIPRTGKCAEYDRGLRVRRQYLTRGGEPLNLARVAHGKVIRVKLAVESEREIPNLVISDLLPAGFEIENPRIATRERLGPALDEASGSKHVEMRDDRLLLFVDIPGAGKRFYEYVVRAVTPGRFVLPAVDATCMYNPAISSVHGAGEVRVVRDE